jgi:hypothetical protein
MVEQDIIILGVKENMRRFLKDYQIQDDFDDDFMNFLPPGFFR